MANLDPRLSLGPNGKWWVQPTSGGREEFVSLASALARLEQLDQEIDDPIVAQAELRYEMKFAKVVGGFIGEFQNPGHFHRFVQKLEVIGIRLDGLSVEKKGPRATVTPPAAAPAPDTPGDTDTPGPAISEADVQRTAETAVKLNEVLGDPNGLPPAEKPQE